MRNISIFITAHCIILSTFSQQQVDTLLVKDDINLSVNRDTLNSINDTLNNMPKSQNTFIEDPVKYSANDSILFDMENKTVHLYGNAMVKYQKIELKAAYIAFNMNDNSVYASGVSDSIGNLIGNPIFKDGNEQFESRWIRYNFKSKKGFVYFVKTEQSGGYLIGDSTKRNANGEIFLKGASFSTCDLDHPHFYLKLTKAKVIPDDKIVSGPAYMVIADIPFKMLFVPFGYVPNTKKRYASGILLPKYGDDNTRGLSLRDGGYYFAISDYMDALITGEIYSKGSWGIQARTNYKLRYRYNGNIAFFFNQNVYSEKGLPDYTKRNDYKITWTHTQDRKANPNTSFSANVNMSSSSYDKRNSYNINDYLTTTRTSNISFSRNWPNTPFSFNGSLSQEQNVEKKTINLKLPQLAFNMNTVYPFRREEIIGDYKWYENIQLNYRANLENRIYTNDSLFLTRHIFDSTNNGFSHELPMSLNIKITKSINLTPSLNYKGVAYSRYYLYQWNNTKNKVDTLINKNPVYAHSLYPSISTGYSPKIYGMYLFRHSRIKAIRHVVSPSVSFGFIPDISDYMPNYYYTYFNGYRNVRESKFAQNLYKTPSPPPGKSASLNFSLRNNFEMKYLPSDTSQKENKITLLDNFDFNANYNLMADSFKLSIINMASSTSFFANKLSVRFDASLDPYQRDNNGRRIDKYEILNSKRLAYLTHASLSMSTSLSSSEIKNTQSKNSSAQDSIKISTSSKEDFSIPWSLNISYSLSYIAQNRLTKTKATYVQSIMFNGNVSLTKKWKISFQSGYDITNRQMNITNISIHRDLHCWEMSISVIPFGPRQSYFFSINALGLLSDLKYTKNNDAWRSRF